MPPTRAGHTPRAHAHRRAARPRSARLSPFGTLLRQWRERRRLSQPGLAMEAEGSTRHLSFVGTGRAPPRRRMVVLLAPPLHRPPPPRPARLAPPALGPTYR